MSVSQEIPALVYDVGGSHVSAAVCSGRDFQLGPVAHAPHPAEASPEAFLSMLHRIGMEAAQSYDNIAGAQLAFPGPFDYEQGVSHMTHKLPYLLDLDLRGMMASRFGWEPSQVRFLNDADAYCLGEVGAGAGHGLDRVVCLTLGTGVGSGFAVGGHAVGSGKGVPPKGEVWDLPYGDGILEDSISTRAVQAHYQRLTGALRAVVEIAEAAAHDPHAAAVFTEFGRHLGLAIRTLLAEFAPQAVVIGGGIARSSQLFLPAAQAELAGLPIELRIAQLQDRAPLVGAGVAWFQRD